MGEHVPGGLQRPFQRRVHAEGRQRGGELFPAQCLIFKGGGLPQSRQQALVGAALQKKARRALHQRHRDGQALLFLFWGLDGQLLGPARRKAPAHRRQRAGKALGRGIGHADQCAQLHQRLVVGAGRGFGHLVQNTFCEFSFRFGFCDVGVIIVQTGEHPQHIAVHRRGRDAEGDAGDGPGGVVPDAGQRPQRVIVGRQCAAVPLTHHPGGLLHVVHPVVVAKALPQLVQCVGIAGGQRRRVRQFPDEPLIVGQRGGHPRLLEHDLADPDMIGRRLLPEGQEPFVGFKPRQQQGRDALHQKPPQVRGKGRTSRMLGMPVTYMSRRSKPRP